MYYYNNSNTEIVFFLFIVRKTSIIVVIVARESHLQNINNSKKSLEILTKLLWETQIIYYLPPKPYTIHITM